MSAALGAASLSDQDLIRVRPTLQLVDHDDIFAAGDVIDWKEQKQSAKSTAHGALVGANIAAFLNKGKLKPYTGATEMIVLTNGKVCCISCSRVCAISNGRAQNAGLGFVDILWGIVLGNWFAKAVKSKTLLVSYFKAEQGY